MMKSLCIDLETLASYIGGTVSDEERDRIEEHLADCEDCRKEFAVASTILNDEELSECEPLSDKESRSIWDKIKGKIAPILQWSRSLYSELTENAWFLLFEPAPAMSRSRSEARQPVVEYVYFSKELSEILEAEMYFRKTEDEKACMKVRVTEESEPAKNVRLTLKREGKKDVSRPLRDAYVAFDDLMFGDYHLVVIQYGKESKADYLLKFRIDKAGIDEQYSES
ncbi:MAG: hypothetical protein BWK80_06955 [Desulfobacteraceae bacterium IS3]|nr:MAG: hypothetical protein BWK80_06955 [Desulfobacteraceae bacterium IS3]